MSILNVEHLTHGFGDRAIFADVSFRLLKGEHIGLVGANGEGKSTFMSIVTGKLMPDEGKVEWAKNVHAGYLDQHAVLEKGMTIQEVLKSAFDPLLQKEQVCYQPFSCQKWGLLKAYPIPYKRLNIIEGSYSMHPYFKNPYHVRIFMNISPEDQIANIKRRNGLEKAKQFQNIWIPKEEAYFEKFHVMDGAIQIMWNLKTEE